MALHPLGLVPIGVAVAVLGLVAASAVDEDWDRSTSRFARRTFGRYVDASPERRRRLRAAYVERSYRAYAARTFLYAAIAGFAGAIGGVYLSAGGLLVLPALVELSLGLPRTMVDALGLRGFELSLTPTETLIVVVAGGVVVGVGSALVTYLVRWQRPRDVAAVRRRNVDAGLPRTVAFMYALSRGGVAFPAVLRTLARHERIYGEGAREARVAVREIDLFGRDVITAIRRMAARTPSAEFETFSENLASVLQSGQRLPGFLHEQYERYQEEAADRQDEILEQLATVAEAYVTVLVAGVLFLITILIVFGLTTTDTLGLLQLLGYLLVPLANLGFVVYLQTKLGALGIASNGTTTVAESLEPRSPERPRPARAADAPDVAPAAGTVGRFRSVIRDRALGAWRAVRSPLETLRWYPSRVLYLSLPLAAVYLLVRAPAAFDTAAVDVRYLDDLLVQATLLVLGSYAVARELHSRWVRRIEAATPEFLERLASLNEAGMTLRESLERLRVSDVDVLSAEVERIWTDVTLGSTVEDAFVRFGRRVRTASLGRVVTLVTNAARASGSLGPVLRIAATQSRAEQRLRRRRRQDMLSYLVVIYVAFAVFLLIIVAVQEVLVPALPTDVPTPPSDNRLGVDADQFARFGSVDKAAYTLVFFHTALIHAVLSGFVGGLLGEGSLRDGAKHAAVLLGVAYVAFLLLSSPVASMTVSEPAVGDEAVTFESVSLSDGGFVALHRTDPSGPVVGQSAYLPAGTHEDVRVSLEGGLSADATVVAVAYLDANDDRSMRPEGSGPDRPYPAPGRGDVVAVTVSASG